MLKQKVDFLLEREPRLEGVEELQQEFAKLVDARILCKPLIGAETYSSLCRVTKVLIRWERLDIKIYAINSQNSRISSLFGALLAAPARQPGPEPLAGESREPNLFRPRYQSTAAGGLVTF